MSLLLGFLKNMVGRPTSAAQALEAARARGKAGDVSGALLRCEQARRLDPGSAAACDLQAQLLLPGPGYYEVLEQIFAQVRPRTYVEIGIRQGDSFRLAGASTLAVGIDPQPRLRFELAPHQKVFAMTSDAFFASLDLREVLSGMPVDLAFIDGMHHFEYALRDFANLERHCSENSTILIHDCFPLDAATAGREPVCPFWSGDVWRLIVLLKKYRPDLRIDTIGTAPTGLGVVRRLDPRSRILIERHDELCREFLALHYSYLDEDKAGKLNLVPNDRARIEELLSRGQALS